MPISISAVVAFALLIANFSNLGPGPPVYGAVQSRPREPKPPYLYDEQEVVYENKKDGVRLAGTLTLPHF
jgi:hypothetical protein